MKAKHTPGPWSIDCYKSIMASRVLVALAGISAGPDRDANARLIAAAPDLLEALKECLGHLERDDQHIDALGRWRPHYVKARDAIDKAEAE